MYRYAASLHQQLRLNDYELHEVRTLGYMWMAAACVGLVCIILAKTLPLNLVPFSGFAFALLGVLFPAVRAHREKTQPAKQGEANAP